MRLNITQFIAWLALCASGFPARADDWPQFRGPTGQGVSAAKQAPLAWSEQEGVTWRTPIPGQGWSSPVVYARQVWLTTAIEAEGSLLLVRAMTGIAVLFEKRLHITDKIHRSRGERGGEKKQAESHVAGDTSAGPAFPITPHGKSADDAAGRVWFNLPP